MVSTSALSTDDHTPSAPPESAESLNEDDYLQPPSYDAFFSSTYLQDYSLATGTAPTELQLSQDITSNKTPNLSLASSSSSSSSSSSPSPSPSPSPSQLTTLKHLTKLLFPLFFINWFNFNPFQLALVIITFPFTMIVTLIRFISFMISSPTATQLDCRFDVLYKALKKRSFNQYYETQFEYQQIIYRRDIREWETDIADNIKLASSWKFWKRSSANTTPPPKPIPPDYSDVSLYKFSTDELTALQSLPYEIKQIDNETKRIGQYGSTSRPSNTSTTLSTISTIKQNKTDHSSRAHIFYGFLILIMMYFSFSSLLYVFFVFIIVFIGACIGIGYLMDSLEKSSYIDRDKKRSFGDTVLLNICCGSAKSHKKRQEEFKLQTKLERKKKSFW